MILKPIMERVVGLSILLIANLSCSIASAATATFDLQHSVETLGSPLTVDIVGTGFPSATDGGAVSVTFEPSVLNADTVTVNTAVWDFYTDPGTIDNTVGTITGIEFVRFTAPTPSNFVIATLQFTLIGVTGSVPSSLELSEYTNGIGGFGAGGDPLAVTFEDGSVAVIPLPAGVWLLASALGVVIRGFKRRGMF